MKNPFKKTPKVLMLEDDPLHAKLDPRPLRAALEAVVEQCASIARGYKDLEKWRADAERWKEDADPYNDASLRQGAFLQDKANLLPKVLEKADVELEAMVEELFAEADRFENAMKERSGEDFEALASRVEALLRPFCTDYVHLNVRVNNARSAALHCSIFNCFNVPFATATKPQDDRSNYKMPGGKAGGVDAYDRTAIDRAEQLLKRYEAWHSMGGKFYPDSVPEFTGFPE